MNVLAQSPTAHGPVSDLPDGSVASGLKDAPAGPVWPVAPAGPAGPAGPVAPVSPFAPLAPRFATPEMTVAGWRQAGIATSGGVRFGRTYPRCSCGAHIS